MVKKYKHPKYYRQYFKVDAYDGCTLFDGLFIWDNKTSCKWRLLKTEKNLEREMEDCYYKWQSSTIILTRKEIKARELKRITEEKMFVELL